jgi:RNA-binding protein
VLTRRRLQELKAEAHHLEPIVQIGHAGLHEAAFAAVVLALRDHELIKVRLHEPENKRVMAEELAKATASALCGLVGHTVILYKPKPQPKRAPVEQREQRPARARVKPRVQRGRAQRGSHTRSSSSSRRRASSS